MLQWSAKARFASIITFLLHQSSVTVRRLLEQTNAFRTFKMLRPGLVLNYLEGS